MTKLAILSVLVMLVLTGCASQPDYRPAKAGGFGYSETKLSEKQYRVHFKAQGKDTKQGMDYALLRAAEVTLAAGHEWFMLVDQQVLVEKDAGRFYPYFGVSQGSSRVGLSTHVGAGDSTYREVETVVTIELGEGEQPTTGKAYNARELMDNLTPETETP